MRNPEAYTVFEVAHKLVLATYAATKRFPDEERYGLTSQLRRAVAAVSTNFSEGCGRPSDGDFARFVDIAVGSAAESEYLFRLAADLGYLDRDHAETLLRDTAQVRRMLFRLARRARAGAYSEPTLRS